MSNSDKYITYTRDIILVGIAQLAAGILRLIELPVMAKWLGADQYGIWSLIWVTVSLVTPVVMMGLEHATVRFLAAERDRDEIRESYFTAFFTVLASSILFSIVISLCADTFALGVPVNTNDASIVMLASLMFITQTVNGMVLTYLRTYREMSWYSGLLVTKGLFEVGLLVTFLALGYGLAGVIIAVLISDVLCGAIGLYKIISQIGFQFPKFTHLKKYLKFGLPLVPNGTLYWIIYNSDRYIIGFFMGAKEVGVFAAACALTNIISFIQVPFNTVLFPLISKLYDAGETAQTQTYLKYTMKYLLILVIPAAVGLSILATPLLLIFTTPEFAVGSAVIPFLACGLVFYCFYLVCTCSLLITGKVHWILWLYIIAAALNLGLNLLLVPRLGILGAALATCIANGVLAALTLIISFRYLKFDLSAVSIVKAILASAIMALVIKWLNPQGIAWLIIDIVLGAVIYGLLTIFLKVANKNELAFFKGLILRVRMSKGHG